MFGPKRRDGAAGDPPDQPGAAIARRNVEDIARHPSEVGGEFSPLAEESGRGLDSLPPLRLGDGRRLLNMQPSP
jgi:hypothetical protein